MYNITITINLLNTLPNVIELQWFLEEVVTIFFFVTGASTNYSIHMPCQTNYEQDYPLTITEDILPQLRYSDKIKHWA